MTDWQPIETAPKDGRIVMLRVAGMSYPCKWSDGYLDSEGRDCGAWEHHGDPLDPSPPGWCGGTCWLVNDDGKPSVRPDAWKPFAFAGQDDQRTPCEPVDADNQREGEG